MNLSNIKIGGRLALGFSVVLGLLVLLIVVGVTRLTQIQTETTTLIDKNWVSADAAHQVNELTQANATYSLQLFVAPDQSARDALLAKIKDNQRRNADYLDVIGQSLESDQGRQLLDEMKQRRRALMASLAKVADRIGSGDKEAAAAITINETLAARSALEQTVSELVALEKQDAQTRGQIVMENIRTARVWMLGVGLSAVVVGIVFALWLSASITRPLRDAVRVAQTVASGDLRGTVTTTNGDETGALLRALAEMNDNLASIVGRVRASTDTIATAASQIAVGNTDLSSRTEEQAASLEQTAASMEELTVTVRRNADSASLANDLANAASDKAELGGQIVERVISTMSGISESASNAAEITGLIEGIAFQTNILALNAAVEAARAGDQGRGFAVVAAEVRTLAQRSAAAAKEIKSLIDQSAGRVEHGARLVEEAGTTIREIVQAVKSVKEIMTAISSASHEQRLGIEQVSQAVTQMDQVTQQNAALVEQASGAAHALSEQAAMLHSAVAVFKIEGALV